MCERERRNTERDTQKDKKKGRKREIEIKDRDRERQTYRERNRKRGGDGEIILCVLGKYVCPPICTSSRYTSTVPNRSSMPFSPVTVQSACNL